MLIAQISDLHFRVRGVRLFGAVDTYGATQRAIDHLLALTPRPDAVIVTGDLVNDGADEDYAALADLFRRLPMPVYPIPGNHDRRELVRRHLSYTGVLPSVGPLRYAVEEHPVRLVGLDTLVEGADAGRLGGEQLDWLDGTLAAAPGTPTLLFLHHPPFATGIGFMDEILLEDWRALAAVVARHRQIEAVTCGHVHRPVQTRFAGTIASIAPGTAHQVTLDFGPDAPAAWIAEPPACLLHLWCPQAGLVSHVSYIGNYGPGVLFA
ncbi:phosphodiesterase [Microbaculum marinisediminis]|uniref:Phosphodiesterase n=1 Tax=Microbaculum marinisediminis TaxID=2931392 RepID=A0AAW5QZ73_9HYPH|nr:phosphodiesterase [Microbaculum sp. A6E488]MCT8971570.1 phosphodiesterase [Microbaculum sp. A6E488]